MEAPAPGNSDARVEQLLRDAHLQRMRKQWAAAETLCRRALELAPDDPMGLEMLGDLLEEKGDDAGSLDAYRKALEKQPQKASLEEKIARGVLREKEAEHDRLQAELLLNSPGRRAHQKRGAAIAVLLSALFPGLGQLVTGERVKGGILLVIGLISLALGFNDFIKLCVTLAFPTPAGPHQHGSGPEVNGLLATFGIVYVLVYIYSFLDAAAQGGRKRGASDL